VLSVNEQTFREEVLESQVPVLVNFWAPWCGLCRVLNPLLLQLQNEWGDHIKLVEVNPDTNFKLANSYRITSLPTLLLFQEGEIHHRFDTFKGRDDLRLTLQNLVAALVKPNSLSEVAEVKS
jgi:thioredoxin 1